MTNFEHFHNGTVGKTKKSFISLHQKLAKSIPHLAGLKLPKLIVLTRSLESIPLRPARPQIPLLWNNPPAGSVP